MTLKLYTIDAEYNKYIKKHDNKIPTAFGNKSNRPFVGIILTINEFNYFAPLSSPKEKFKNMKNDIDFIKIKNGELGAINLNNMIPIHPNLVTIIDTAILKDDSKDNIKYKFLLINQINWINKNQTLIFKKAKKLYIGITNNKFSGQLKVRCVDFKKVENALDTYCIDNNLR